MEWILLAVGLLLGSGATWGVMKNKPPTVIETNKVIEKMVEVDKSLTEADLLKIPCSKDYMEKNGQDLCREMFCRMNTRGGATQQTATSKECEAISNLINTKVILKTCDRDVVEENNTSRENCERLFEKRK